MCHDIKATHDSRKENIHNPLFPKIKNQKNQITPSKRKIKSSVTRVHVASSHWLSMILVLNLLTTIFASH
jgi:hypothetical protein